MSELTSESAQLVITSPPYWQLKDYGSPDQIGFHDSYEEYLSGLARVWSQCYRALSPGCRLCINIGDQFARAAHYGRYKVIPIHSEVIAACERIGFDYMGSIIWRKATTVNTSGGAVIMGSFPHPRNGIVKIDYEFVLLFKKLGKAPKVTPERKAASKLSNDEWNEYFYGHWNFPGEKQGSGHLAMFPMELPRRLIKMFSFVGETVLDPYLGSGTTLAAARELDRQGIGYEINRDFEPAIRERLGCLQPGLFGENHEPEFIVSRADLPIRSSITANDSAVPIQRLVNPKDQRFDSIIEMADFKKPRGRPRIKSARSLIPDP